MMDDMRVTLEMMDAELTALKNQYDLFFQGGRRGEPSKERKVFENKLLALSRRTIIKSADQHRFSNIQGKFWSNANLWARIMRDFEEGRLRRDKRGALTRVGGGGLGATTVDAGPAAASSAPAPAGPGSASASAAAARPAGGADQQFDQAAKELLEARKKCGLRTDPSELAALRNSLQMRAKELSSSAGGKNVEFRVVVEGGKPKVKARLS